MKTQTLTIKNWLPDMNTYINHERSNKYLGASYKKEWTEIACQEARSQKLTPIKNKVYIYCQWIMTNQRRDPDNIAYTLKFILDGLVMAGVLTNDGWKNIGAILHYFELDTKESKPSVRIFLN